MKNIILLVLLSITLAVKAAYADYASLLYKASAFESIIALDKDNADKYDELKAASVQLSSVPVSEALPELMSLFEDSGDLGCRRHYHCRLRGCLSPRHGLSLP